MPEFALETTYHLPVFRQRTREAETPEAACRLAIEDYDWSDQKEDYESSGETFVTGIWQGADSAYRGPTVPVPPHFEEMLQRQARHFEVLLGLLKILLADAGTQRRTAPEWLGKAKWAVQLAEAILDGAPGPDTGAGDIP
ncbi:hypothetical protein RFM99_20935 [Mesorhizobium sp. VK4C]|uniref:hypothetical protein n=1 Tax=Mesorhizobium captivum TaxID=3072319 RepID=UPI002A241B3D|nr:hypothetical protein [Mesorhizobium sp. VK4C]MDX8500865.1 hypothetical protein [Mesorhizobium sp. VK4C]